MRATDVLQNRLRAALGSMYALRCCVLFRALESTMQERRLTPINLACPWPHGERIPVPLKALDRAARYGGEEFVTLMSGPAPAAAADVRG